MISYFRSIIQSTKYLVFIKGLKEHCFQRSNSLNSTYLADFAANYKFTKTACDDDYNIDCPKEIEDVDVSRDDYFAELVMLFFPMAKCAGRIAYCG